MDKPEQNSSPYTKKYFEMIEDYIKHINGIIQNVCKEGIENSISKGNITKEQADDVLLIASYNNLLLKINKTFLIMSEDIRDKYVENCMKLGDTNKRGSVN